MFQINPKFELKHGNQVESGRPVNHLIIVETVI